MKTLRYIWIVLGLLSVVEISAATYGMSYRAPQRQIAYYPARTEIPSAMMGSVNSDMMYSGTALPLAAATGTSTAGDSPTQGGPRRATMEDPDPFGGQTIGGTTNPTEPGTPIGDAVIPLLIMAMLFSGIMALRRKKQVKRLNR